MAFSDLASGSGSGFLYVHAAALTGLLVVLYLAGVGVYRLVFSPIAHIPGPKLAALTWGYEFFYDVVLGGQYTFKIMDLHRRYGPVVRINPAEVHVGDPDFYPVLHPGTNRRREKWRFFTKQFGADESAFTTINHDHYMLRRAALNPFFSTANVKKLQLVIEERVDALLERFREYGKTSSERPLDLVYPFSAFTYDVVNEYAFAKCFYEIEDASFGKEMTDYLLTGTRSGKMIQHMDIIPRILNALPDSTMDNLIPGWAGWLRWKRDIQSEITSIQATKHTKRWHTDITHPTIFHSLLDAKVLPPGEKTVARLSQESQILIQAGTLPTSWALSVACFHLLNTPPTTLCRLRDELAAAMPDPRAPTPPLATLERLPYLHAVVKEALRLSIGIGSRLTRVCPDEDLVYTDPSTGKRSILPSGTAISMTTYQSVTDDRLFPDPLAFHPERWLGVCAQDAYGYVIPNEARLDHYAPVFGSSGSRGCLGKALAQAELHLMLAKLWRVWGSPEDQRPGDVGVVKIYETTVRDVEMARDAFVPVPWKGSKGVRVVLETN